MTAERISIAPKPTRYVDMKSISAYKGIWATSNRMNLPYLPYDSFDADGKALQAPQDTAPQAVINDTTTAQSNYQQLLSGITGMPEAGQYQGKSQQQTATEILTKSKSSEVSNYQFIDNASEATKAIGKVWLELATIVYDTERLLPYVNEEGEQDVETVNFQDLQLLPSEMDVEADAGPMQATTRQEALNAMFALGSLLGPDATLVFSEEIVSNADFKGSEKVAKKLGLLSQAKTGIGGKEGQEQDPEAVQALQQADQTIETLQSNIQQLQAYISQMQVAEQVAHIEGKVKLITQQMADETKILLKQMDLAQADKEAQAKLQADYDSKQMDLQKELIKLYSAQPQVSSIDPNPSLNAINGQRNTVFAM
jgi:hypothetical protein